LDNKIILWDGKDLRQFLQLNDDQTTGDVYQPSLSFGERSTASKSSIYALNASRSGDFIVSGSADNLIKIWDARSGKKEACLVGHGDLIRALLISSDGRTVVSAAADGLVKVWSMVTLKCLYSFADFSDSVWSLASAHPTGAVAEAETDYLQAFYAGGRDGLIMFYDNVGYAADADVKRRVIGQQQSTGPVSSVR
jgi:WD40 repeat protein